MRVPQVEASRKSCVASRSLSKTRTSTMWSREMHRNLASAKKLLGRLKELKNPCFTGGWKEWQVNPWNVNFKMKPTLLWCKILREISWSHCIGDQKHHLSQSVFQPSSLYIAFFFQLYNFNSKKAVAVFSSLKEILSKMKSDQGAVFCIRGTDVAAQVSFPYWEKDWPFDLRSHKMKLNSINLPKFTIGYVKKLLGLNQHHKSHEH